MARNTSTLDYNRTGNPAVDAINLAKAQNVAAGRSADYNVLPLNAQAVPAGAQAGVVAPYAAPSFNQPVSVASLASQPYQLPSAPTMSPALSSLGSRVSQMAVPSNIMPPPAATPQSQARSGVVDRLTSLLTEQAGRADYAADAKKEQDVYGKQQKVTEIENKITAVDRFYEKEARKIQKNAEGKFGGAVNQDLRTLERQAAEEKADLAIVKATTLGDFNTALAIAQDKVDTKFEPIAQQVDLLKQIYAITQDDLSASEKIQAQTEIQRQEAALQFEREKELTAYKSQIEQQDPMYQARLQTERLQQENIRASIEDKVSGGKSSEGKPLTAEQQKKADAQVELLDLLGQYRQVIADTNFITANYPSNSLKITNLKNQITSVYKTAQQLGTLDAGVQKLIDGIIPTPGSLSRGALSKQGQLDAIDNFIMNQTKGNTGNPLNLDMGNPASDPLKIF